MNYICVFDFETDSLDIPTLGATEVACTMIDPYRLEIVSGSQFYSKMRPLDIDKDNYLEGEGRKRTINFHLKLRGIELEELLEEWRHSPTAEVVWKEYAAHVNKYNKSGKVMNAPIPAGKNIRKFDIPIAEKYNSLFNIKKLYSYKMLDLEDYLQHWLMWQRDVRSYAMDNIRDYMGMDKEQAHTADKDVYQEAQLLIKFLKLHKELSTRIKFKNCFKNKEVAA